MKQYRISTVRLIAATWGDKFTPPQTGTLPHVLAEIFATRRGLDFQTPMSVLMRTWRSQPVQDGDLGAIDAMVQARKDLGKAITDSKPGSAAAGASGAPTTTDPDYTLESPQSAYRPVLDTGGNVVAHETMAWLLADGTIVQTTNAPDTPFLQIIATVYITVEMV